jgi:hypothetical protein
MRMKRILIVGAALACMVSSLPAVSAEAQTGPAAGGDKPAAKKETVAIVSGAAPRRSRATEDARHCLKEGNNLAIIRCAEQYR